MRGFPRVSSPGHGLVILLAVVVLVTCALGIWQVQRGRGKQHKMHLFEQAMKEPPIPWQTAMGQIAQSAKPIAYRKTITCGVFDGAHQFLLEGRGKDTGEPQYEVWTPLRLASGYLIVSRGLVQHDRHVGLDVSTAPRCVQGLLRPWPAGGVRLGPGIMDEESWPKVAVAPNPEEIGRALGQPIIQALFLLAPEEPDGFARHWRMDGFGPSRHFGYAMTWFVMAACALAAAAWLVMCERS
jgi:cytochrome oxidase assembly protein ShyY1